ncbi:MAG: cell wall hydrolase [Rhizomicrobium sp.]
MKSRDAIARSDRVLVGALAIVLATASAAVGSSLNARPSTEKVTVVKVETPVVRVVPEPVVATGALRASAADMFASRLMAEHRCLSEAIYYETRGNTDDGQKAVAEVILNRIHSGNYAGSICEVVYQGARNGHCQFSWVCSGAVNLPREPREWRRAQELAARILTGEEEVGGLTGGAVGFHAVSVHPDWGVQYVRTVEIGGHVFYRRAGHGRTRGA